MPFGIDVVKRHLVRYGRSSEYRTSRGPQEPDSSDDEWEADAAAKVAAALRSDEKRDSGIQVRGMLQDMYQQVQEIEEAEEKINDITMSALEDSDNITGVNTYPVQFETGEGSRRNESDDVSDLPQTEHPPEDMPFEQWDQEQSPHNEGEQPPGSADRVPNLFNSWMDNVDTAKLEEERLKDARALEDAMKLLFNGSKHTKLGATVMLVNLVATHPGITEKAADDIMATMKNLLPPDNCLPGSLYQAKTLTKRLGLDFKNIDGCINGCSLFDQVETKDLDRCPKCQAPRFKDMFNRTRPLKVLRQFRITPRLQRIFRIPVLSKLMRWHKENPSSDGKVRYPADSRAWKHLDNMDPQIFDTQGFGRDERDVRIQVSCDGICPFKLHKSTWSAWPVITTFLNLPPWLITKKFFTMLALLIPGKAQVPFEFFDVWIRPLIDELKELWNGVPAYDVLKPEGERLFKLRAAVLYTTHDFPGYGTVSGAAHQGYVACPPCGDQLKGKYMFESRKMSYRDARRWVRQDHYIRSDSYNKFFDGQPETRDPPIPKTPAQQRAAFKEYTEYLERKRSRQDDTAGPSGRPRKKNKRSSSPDPSKKHGIKRWSIFYELPYWEVSLLCIIVFDNKFYEFVYRVFLLY